MPEPSLLPERIFGLSAVDGRRTVRPGEVIAFRFRAKNGSEVPTPPALLVLVLPPGWVAARSARSRDSVGRAGRGTYGRLSSASRHRGCDHGEISRAGRTAPRPSRARLQRRAHARVRPPAPQRPGERRAHRARRRRDAARQRHRRQRRRCRGPVRARGRAAPRRGSAPKSRRSRRRATNCRSAGTLTYAFTMAPLEPAAATVSIDDAFVGYEGGRVSLMTTLSAVLAPDIAAPVIEADRQANRLDLGIRIANDGWVAARDVSCSLELPAGWRVLRGTMRADGAPPTIRRDGDSEKRRDDRAAARNRARLRRRHRCGKRRASARRGRPHRSLRRTYGHVHDPAGGAARAAARRAAGIGFCRTGTIVPVAVDVHNTGETNESVSVTLDAQTCWTGELRAGTAAAFVARYAIPRRTRRRRIAAGGC